MIILKCDRCNREIETHKGLSNPYRVNIWNIPIDEDGFYIYGIQSKVNERYNLCKKCYKELKKFMKNC